MERASLVPTALAIARRRRLQPGSRYVDDRLTPDSVRGGREAEHRVLHASDHRTELSLEHDDGAVFPATDALANEQRRQSVGQGLVRIIAHPRSGYECLRDAVFDFLRYAGRKELCPGAHNLANGSCRCRSVRGMRSGWRGRRLRSSSASTPSISALHSDKRMQQAAHVGARHVQVRSAALRTTGDTGSIAAVISRPNERALTDK